MKKNPLVIFTSLAVASLAGLVAASYDRMSGTSDQPAATQEQAAEQSGQPESAEQPAATAEGQQAAVTPEQPAEQPAAEQPAAEEPPAEQPAAEQAAPVKPTFDTVRVEKTGEAVIAGRAEPGAEVAVKLNGETVGTAVANEDGAFVVIPEKPLPQGAGELSIESKAPGASEIAESEAKVAVAVPEQPDSGAMVAVVKPDEPTQVIQQPAAEDTQAESGGTTAEAPAKADKPASMVSLDTVDYDDSGNLLFSGRSQPGATVRIYVDNAAVGDAVAGSDGRWTFAGTASIAPGNHTLRADELDSSGGVTSRVELPFFREEPKQVAAAAPEAGEQAAGEAPAEQPSVEQPAAEEPAAGETEQQQAAASAEPAGTTEGGGESTEQVAAQPSAGASESAGAEPKQGRIVIQPGNNLWRISRVIYGRGVKYTVIYEANKERIRDPDLIYPGQVFATPDVVPPETIDPKRRTPLTPEEGGTAAQP